MMFFQNVLQSLPELGSLLGLPATPPAAPDTTAFFRQLLGYLRNVVLLIGAGLAVWGIINLLEGYGNDNPGAKSQGMKQLMAGIGVIVLGASIPLLLEQFLS